VVKDLVEAASSRLKTRPEAASTEPDYNWFDYGTPISNVRGNLPHWRQDGVIYFVTFRTADSLPEGKLAQWLEEREAWLKINPEPHNEVLRRQYARFSARIEEGLDAGYGDCLLADPGNRKIVEDAIRFFDGQRYRLDEFVVMPNHVHALLTPLGYHRLSGILHSWKSFTAKRINARVGRVGTFWQKESFDHIVRSVAHFERFRHYIRENSKAKARPEAASTLVEG
jgi:REP element-mobilizing transposase RayT